MVNLKFIFVLLVASVLLLGCTSSVSKVDNTVTSSSVDDVVVASTPTPEVDTFKVASIGESLSNEKLAITLNSVDYPDFISETDQYVIDLATERWVVVDITIQNLEDSPTSLVPLTRASIKDSDGYSYDYELLATQELSRGFEMTETIQPGQKVRGQIAFAVPTDANGLQLVYDFGVFDQAQAIFDIS